MDQLFNDTALESSRLITRRYSTSFSLGISMLDKKFHMPVYAVYGFVRYADEIVDTFHNYNKKELLSRFREETYRAIEEKISLNPILHSYQLVVNQYGIERELTDAFLNSMEMDLQPVEYTNEKYNTYIFGSAEVVGLMCLRVFCEGDNALYDSLKPAARKLGSAFQKINFLRDIKSDYEDRQRVYFPGVTYCSFNDEEKVKIEKDIKEDFDAALDGILNLPDGARLGVYLAYTYYVSLFKKIQKLPCESILKGRIRIADRSKFWLLFRSWIKYQMNTL